MVKIFNQAVEEWCKNYRSEKFHALFCDAPYSLGDGTKGFMNKEWDNNIACNPDTWRALAEHLLPGAFLFVFAGTLNDDLISVAMRQAGLRKFHKAVLYWGFSSGFPKASRIDTAIDRAAGAERKLISTHKQTIPQISQRKNFGSRFGDEGNNNKITAPATPLAKTWAGHRYGLQSLKPSAETILIFCKPFEKGLKPVDSITKNGSGALNIDRARIKTKAKDFLDKGRTATGVSLGWANTEHGEYFYDGSKGRWPANLILQHSPSDNGTCSPSCPVRELDEQSGELGKSLDGNAGVLKNQVYGKYATRKNNNGTGFGDTGGASRFFFNADWSYEAAEKIEQAADVRYCAKAARTERENGLIGNIACLVCGDLDTAYHIVCGDKKYHISMAGRDGVPTISEIKQMWRRYRDALKSGGKKTKQPEWSLAECRRNDHPTVKPLSLCKYLATLLLPPNEYAPRRILISFAGVASEAIGAMLAGWEEIVAIEKEKDYCDIGAARVKFWQNHKEPKVKPKKKVEAPPRILQETLF